MNPFTQVKSGRRHEMSTPKSVSNRVKHLWHNYKRLNFHLKTEFPWPLMCKLYLKIFKNVAALASFQNRTSVPQWRLTNQFEVLEGESLFSWKLLFFFFHYKKTYRWFFWTFRAFSSWRRSSKYINSDFWNCFELFPLLRLSRVRMREFGGKGCMKAQ